jgi:hypothetical protein
MNIENYNAQMLDGLAKFSPFKRELVFYRDIEPKIEGLLASSKDNITKMFPRFVYCGISLERFKLENLFQPLSDLFH